MKSLMIGVVSIIIFGCVGMYFFPDDSKALFALGVGMLGSLWNWLVAAILKSTEYFWLLEILCTFVAFCYFNFSEKDQDAEIPYGIALGLLLTGYLSCDPQAANFIGSPAAMLTVCVISIAALVAFMANIAVEQITKTVAMTLGIIALSGLIAMSIHLLRTMGKMGTVQWLGNGTVAIIVLTTVCSFYGFLLSKNKEDYSWQSWTFGLAAAQLGLTLLLLLVLGSHALFGKKTSERNHQRSTTFVQSH